MVLVLKKHTKGETVKNGTAPSAVQAKVVEAAQGRHAGEVVVELVERI
jgi:hypothetical protein